MNTTPLVPLAAWKQRYEALRQHVLERRQVLGADPLGLVVLLKQGVADWMKSWWDPPPLPALAAPPPSRPSTPQWQQQLTELLAHMTVEHL